ncbi:MAG: carboxypeptidase-like regulatory domain-containing protein [Kofleriaceae bacterium]
MKASWIALAFGIVAVGCGGESLNPNDGIMPDATSCDVAISFSPSTPIAGELVQATAIVIGVQGVPSYAWEVLFDNAVIAQGTASGIAFAAAHVGEYDVRVTVTAPGENCPQAQSFLAVNPAGNGTVLRLRVTPPATSNALPYVRPIRVNGASTVDFQLDGVDPINVSVVQPSMMGVAAYVRFEPQGLLADAPVEAFSSPSGAASVRLYPIKHDVLVVPLGTVALAPRRIVGWMPGTPLTVDGGTVVSGTVTDSNDAAISGAWVKLTVDGVPSTLASTDSNGAFAVRASWIGTPVVKVEVTPPVALALPRVEASSVLALGQPLQISYAPSTPRSTGGVHVDYAGAAAANADVMFVGELPGAATITSGGSSVMATGYVRIALRADGSGDLASAAVPAAALNAVVALPSGDRAVVGFDTSTAVPAAIDAPAMSSSQTSALGPDGALDTAVLRLIPRGALALAGAPEQVVKASSGMVTARLASGGSYDLRWYDPSGRAGGMLIEGVTTASLQSAYTLPEPLEIHGAVRTLGSPNPLVGASVQVLCGDCAGLERDRPIAETISTFHGYSVIVPRPPAM